MRLPAEIQTWWCRSRVLPAGGQGIVLCGNTVPRAGQSHGHAASRTNAQLPWVAQSVRSFRGGGSLWPNATILPPCLLSPWPEGQSQQLAASQWIVRVSQAAVI